MTMRTRRVVAVLVALALLLLPLVFRDAAYPRHLLVLCLLFAVLASNWDLGLGYAGIFNFAHIAVFALGAYASAILAMSFGVSPWWGIPAGALVGAAAGILAFIPSIRLRGLYVSLTTFAFAQVCFWLILSQSDWTGGARGLTGIPAYEIGTYSFRQEADFAYSYLAIGLFLASTIFLRRIVTSDVGRSFVALRDNEAYAVSRGVSVVRQHGLVFLLSSIFTGATGAVYAHYIGAVNLDLFGFEYVALLLSMVWLGGVGTIYGPILGAVAVTFSGEALATLGPWRIILISVLTVVTLRFLPDGLWGTASRLLRRGSRPPPMPPPAPGDPIATLPPPLSEPATGP
jgi:branched-chain amino acid transport system permease protein